MTKAQRAAKAKRAGAKRRKANAAAAFLKKMNPGKKLPAAVRVKRLAGGGISVTPIKMNAGPFSRRKTKKRVKLFHHSEEKYMQQFRRLGRHARGKKTRRAR